MADNGLTLEGVHRRLAALEAEKLILETLGRYGHAVDYGDIAMLGDCFVDDVKHLTNRVGNFSGRADVQASSRDESMRQRYSTSTSSSSRSSRSMEMTRVTCSRITCSSRIARPGPSVSHHGRYRDRVVRRADGRWRLKVSQVEKAGRLRPMPGKHRAPARARHYCPRPWS